ncbi:MAG: FtsH protease activity modulator HflK [Chromatiales bacterium]
MSQREAEGVPMAWDEPGGGSRDPWGGKQQDGPPDLDEVVRRMQERLRNLFGGRRGRNGGSGGAPGRSPAAFLPLILIIGGLVLLANMFYIVQPGERGLVLRFGAYVVTLEPGWTIRLPPPIERVEKVNADLVRSMTHKAAMLTRDENIIDIELEVQYKIKDVHAYAFKVRDPDETIRRATEAAVREIVGANTMDFALTEGRLQIAVSTRDTLQGILDQYQTGLVVNVVNIKAAKPPEEVKAAFDDAIKAREDEQRLINEAEAYKNEIIPKARGTAARHRAEAEAYMAQVTARAEGDASRFTQLVGQYQRAPEVTRERLYLEALEAVLGNTTKVIVDTRAGNQILYLPLDKLVQRQQEEGRAPAAGGSDDLATEILEGTAMGSPAEAREHDAARERGRR